MQSQHTPSSIPISRAGVCVVDGWGVKLRVERRRLVISDGIGRSRREVRLARAGSGLRRLVLLGHSGYVTLEAVRFVSDSGAAFLHLDHEGRVLLTSAGYGLDDPRLRRAQAAAFGAETGMAIARDLIRRKLAGQARVAAQLGATEALIEIDRAVVALGRATTPAELMVPEAAAAAAYWAAWSGIELRWAKADLARVPDRWRTFGGRSSPITGNPRAAGNPANATLNYLYAILEGAARLSLLAIGLDPGLGVLHADQKARDSMALDAIEAARADVDALVLDLLRTRTFRASDFVERRDGSCRIVAPFTHELVTTLPTWEAQMAPIVEGVARAFAAGPESRMGYVPTLLTGDRRSAGRDGVRRTEPRRIHPRTLVTRVCRTCGGSVATGRVHCDACLPEVGKENLAALLLAGHEENQRRRHAGTDRSHGGDAARRRGQKVAASRRAAGEWQRANGPASDPETFRREVLPLIRDIPAAKLAELTGLSRPYCSAILRGRRVPHPRLWQALHQLGVASRRTPVS